MRSGFEAGIFARDLEHAAPSSPITPTNSPHFVPVREAARHRMSVGRLMVARARGGEADRAGADRSAHFALHRCEVIFGVASLSNARSPIT